MSTGIRQTIIPILLFSVVSVASGQSALDGFDPNPNDTVRVVAVQPDGKILLGGHFTTLSPNGGKPVTRNHIARLNADGTLDAAFNPNANSTVYAIEVQPDGKIVVGGGFTSIGGQARNYIARLDATTGLVDSFDPHANSGVLSIAVQADGRILAGGVFTGIGGQLRNYIARLDATTGLADSFDPHVDTNNSFNAVYAIAVQADGKILASGVFTSIGGQMRNNIARLDATTSLADSFNPNASNVVGAIAVQADGKILVGGYFTSIGGQPRNNMARLYPATGSADSFNPNANDSVRSIAVQSDGKILAAGQFTSIGSQTRKFIARLDVTNGSADSFDPSAESFVYSIAVQSDGKVLAGGEFNGANGIGGQTRNHVARLETDGKVDRTMNLILSGGGGPYLTAAAIQLDGKILIGGSFTSVAGVPRGGIARLNHDGTLDMAFNPMDDNNPFPAVSSILIQSDGKILVGGGFTYIGGQPRRGIARIDSVTGLADSFDPNVGGTGWISAIISQSDGKLIVGGAFESIGGQLRNNIARLDPITGLADSFDPMVNHWVYTLAIQSDGKILAGGAFRKVGGQARNRMARLDPVTGLADSFDPDPFGGEIDTIAIQQDGKILVGGYLGAIGGQTRWGIARLDPITGQADSFDPRAGQVYSVAEQADGKVLASGDFTTASGLTRNRIARFDSTTGSPDSFDPNANGTVTFVSILPDGKVLAGGNFTNVGGQTQTAFARLSNDSAALRSLEVTPATIVWRLQGASPGCVRVHFEISSDNLNYVDLGNGTRKGTDWVLSGLSLPTGTNVYVRARGFYRTGMRNSSESIMESVKNVFLAPMPTPSPTPACFTCSRNR